MPLGSGLKQSVKSNRNHLRKTKENAISPFGWKVGKKGKALNKKNISEEDLKAIRDRIKKQQKKSYIVGSIALIVISFIMFYIFFF